MRCGVERLTTNDQRLTTNDQRPTTDFLPDDSRAFQRPAGVVAQRHIHEDFSAGSIEAHHHRFGVFTAFAALLGSVQGWGTNMKVKSLVVERGDSVANDLVGQLTDRFAYQIVALGDFDARQKSGELHRRPRVRIKNDRSEE